MLARLDYTDYRTAEITAGGVGEYILCSRVSGRSGLDQAILRSVTMLYSGDLISFSGSNQATASMIGVGWAGPEAWGRWMRGKVSAMIFKIPPSPRRDVQIALSTLRFLPLSRPIQRVGIRANGHPLPEQSITSSADPTLALIVPARFVGDDGLVNLVFDLPDAVSPASPGLSRTRVNCRSVSRTSGCWMPAAILRLN